MIAEVGRGALENLPPRYQLVTRFSDAVVTRPRGITADLRAELAEEFSPEELVELTFTVALATAFSKVAIAWGPPAEMPVLEVPTPTPKGLGPS